MQQTDMNESACFVQQRNVSTDFSEEYLQSLLRRDRMSHDLSAASAVVGNNRILITGAGSIGIALSKIVLTMKPELLVVVDWEERAVIEAERALELGGAGRIHIEQGSVGNPSFIRQLIASHGINTVFHTAAYKHLAALELDPIGAIRNNVLAAWNVLRACEESLIGRFVFVSTDKAHRPTSVLGASKRLLEMLLESRGVNSHYTTACALRFGNVLGSSGSVLEEFAKRLSAGTKLRISDNNAERFFLLPSEASFRLLEVASIAEEGRIFVAPSGASLRITDLARRFLESRGEVYSKRWVERSGLKQGEKLSEILVPFESTADTSIIGLEMLSRPIELLHDIYDVVDNLTEVSNSRNQASARAALVELVPEYH